MWRLLRICMIYLLGYSFYRSTSAMTDDGSYLNKMTIQGGIATLAKHIAPDNSFLIASCKKQPAIDCVIIRGKLSHRLNPYLNETCTFKPPRDPNSNPMMPLELERLGGNRSIASWFEIRGGQTLRKNVAIIDMTTCVIKSLSFEQPHFNGMTSDTVVTNLLVYQNSFDVITSDPVKCQGIPKCRIEYDQEGFASGDPMPFPTSLHQFRAIERIDGNPTYGFLAIGEPLRESPDAKRAPARIESVSTHMGIVKNMDADVVMNGSSSHATISNANGKFTLCAITKNYFEVIWCNQFKMDPLLVGKEPKMRLGVTYFDKVRAMSVHNLRNGGFLILVVGSPENMEPTLVNTWYGKLTVYGAGSPQKIGKILETELKFECKDNLILGTNELDDKYCFYFSCDTVTYASKRKKPTNYLKIYQKCLPRSEVEALKFVT